MIERIVDALDASRIKLELTGRRKTEIIKELVDVAAGDGRLSDREAVTRQVLEREQLTTTGIGGGIAIPHCLTPAVTETVMAIGRKSAGARFDAIDKQPVKLFFLIIGPPGAHNEHLRLLSRLARYLHDPRLKQALLGAEDPQAVIDAFGAREQER